MRNNAVYIIAEAGVNHNGNSDMAYKLIDVAAEAGANAIKFQTYKAGQLILENIPKAEYQVKNTGSHETQLEMLKKLELPFQLHFELQSYCNKLGIQFLSTAFDFESLDLLSKLKVPIIKIPSGDITSGPLLLKSAQMRRKIFLSTGMTNVEEIKAALKIIAFGLIFVKDPKGFYEFEDAYTSQAGKKALKKYVSLLHCVTEYPAPLESVNLRALDLLANTFELPIGYSDHTLGLEVPFAAVGRGAVIIEKHFTLDRGLPGPDHKASLEPAELIEMVRGIRGIESSLGRCAKTPSKAEISNRAIARRSIVTSADINNGDVLNASNLAFKRPGTGISPMRYWDLLGNKVQRNYKAGELLE
jgi:N-acetylneuraminate synthase